VAKEKIEFSEKEKKEMFLKSIKSRGGRPPQVIPDKTKYNRKKRQIQILRILNERY
jgi:hypothetical protein